MLETLHIKNLALVTELDVEFGAGLNTITGETGAGKSLIIGAVQLLAGGRATPSSIRKGEKSCEVAGVFYFDKVFDGIYNAVSEKLEAAGVSGCEDRRLLVRRVITETGSRAYVNGSLVTAGFLKDVCDELIDLHGPHDNQSLLKNSKQLAMLDVYAGLEGLVGQVREAFEKLAEIRRELQALKADGLSPEEADLLEYQLHEIDDAALDENEEENLLMKYKRASNSRRLIQIASSVQEALSEADDSVAERISEQLRQLRELQQLDPEHGDELASRLEEICETVRDFGSDVGEYAENLDIDQEELARMEERIDLIQKLRRKYGPGIQDVLDTAERIRARLENIRGRSGRLEALAAKEKEAEEFFLKLCRELSAKRRECTDRLAAAIQEKLHVLGFMRASFEIAVKDAAPSASGIDAVEFEFAANVGEDMQPLRAVASSGEIARVMLAVKTVLSDADNVPVLIFDEIDANVGGRVAVAVADELRAVGLRHQVFSITHMPQIAAAGQQHYLVEKRVVGDRTETGMTKIDGEERRDEIVRMLGAEVDSSAAVAHACELLKY